MDIMIFLIILYIVAYYFVARVSVFERYKKYHRIIMTFSLVAIIFGCLTPFNFIYTFLFAYILLLVNFIINKYFFRNLENKKI